MEKAEYGTTVLRDNTTSQKSLSKTYTDGDRGSLRVQDTAGKRSLVYTHIHPNESTSSITGSHLSAKDVALAIARGITVQVGTPRGVQDRYRPSEKVTWQERKDEGGIIERRDNDGKWDRLRGAGDMRLSADLVEKMAKGQEQRLESPTFFIGPVGLFNGRPY